MHLFQSVALEKFENTALDHWVPTCAVCILSERLNAASGHDPMTKGVRGSSSLDSVFPSWTLSGHFWHFWAVKSWFHWGEHHCAWNQAQHLTLGHRPLGGVTPSLHLATVWGGDWCIRYIITAGKAYIQLSPALAGPPHSSRNSPDFYSNFSTSWLLDQLFCFSSF